MPKLRRRLVPCLVLTTLACACSNRSSSGSSLAPPALRIIGLENARGDTFEEDEIVELACDPRLTALTGPSADAGFLENWSFRPPGACGSLRQCGYIRLELLANEDVVETVSRASLAVVIDRDASTWAGITGLRVTLIDGRSDDPFLVEDVAVSDAWALEVRPADGCGTDGSGAAGGAGGQAGNSHSPLGGLGGQSSETK